MLNEYEKKLEASTREALDEYGGEFDAMRNDCATVSVHVNTLVTMLKKIDCLTTTCTNCEEKPAEEQYALDSYLCLDCLDSLLEMSL